MKIGTVTFWYSKENYGAMLQCFALLKYLNKLGHDAKLIRIKPVSGLDVKNPRLFRLLNMFFSLFKYRTYQKVKYKFISKPSGGEVDRGFADFLQRHIPTYPQVYTFDEIDKHPLDAQAIICGSDQVWGGISQTYFLRMHGDYKRISYAASFGGAKYDNLLLRKTISSWLKQFDLITVREQEGVDLCKKMGVDATLAPDPTLLLNQEDYLSIVNCNYHESEPYIFLYLLGKEITVEVKDIFIFAKKNNLGIKYVASQGRYDQFEKIYPSVEEWVSLLHHAKYVITNSFHGTVFSMIFEKPFLTFPIIGESARMNSRIETLFDKYNMHERLYKGNMDVLFNPISFEVFKRKLNAERLFITNLLNREL